VAVEIPIASEGDFMPGENSYFSRFFVKFVEVSAAGLASAICAYLLAHFGGFLPAHPPATAVQVGPTASEIPESRRGPPSPRPVEQEQRSEPQRNTDAAVAQPAPKSMKDAKGVPPRKRTKTDTSVSEKETNQKSAEALARAALANVDATRPAPTDAPIGPNLSDTPAPAVIQSRRGSVPPRQADVGPPQPAAAPRRAGGMEVEAAHVQPPAEISPSTGTNLQPGARDVPDLGTPTGIQSRPVATADPLSPKAKPPLEISAPQQPPTADQDKGVFSGLKLIPDLVRPVPPAPIGETPRPPMPVGTASPE
jgi:hypothetical protein